MGLDRCGATILEGAAGAALAGTGGVLAGAACGRFEPKLDSGPVGTGLAAEGVAEGGGGMGLEGEFGTGGLEAGTE
jgi:hypothetical protein